MESSAIALAITCLFTHFFLFFIIFDILAKSNMMNSVLSKELPLGPIVFVLSFFILLALVSLIRIRHSMNIKRQVINRFRNYNKTYTILYLISTSTAFVSIIVLLLMNR
ncbi:MAG TPA: hypothetical protein DHV29_06485 [Bacteroidales bacterium]|nr:MAG: hypothetical protein A2W94_05160 [Bacteroidetes bacterium GWE2_42_42]HBG69424.1 hypothetical protein [Bacteroidales bacterium]HCB62043.1 hypothetical protein [Bacteroidales bacterium]HCY23121.1 hypothetical protein [Bacteroidales bacterium]